MAYKTRQQLMAENAKLRKQVNKGTKKASTWVSMTGQECQSEFTMNMANKAVKRHLSDDCGCFKGAGKKGRVVSYTCKAVKWDAGFTQANAGMGIAKARKAGLIV